MSQTVIQVKNLSKQYRLGEVGTGTLAHDLNRWWHRLRGKEDPYLKIGETNDRAARGNSQYVWALRDIDFEVKQGEVLGIIGKNGAGKSTLLKLLSKVTAPTTGSIKAKGRIASLLEVGTGFHPELTGRENIFLNGAILGMTKREIAAKLDEIVDFAGVERYLDTPVKRYSSGMMVRLGFAVAAHLEPEILIVDEVLAVGDAEFQKKAVGKMQDVSRKGGRTVLFVSHNMGSINTLCSKAMLLDKGRISAVGNTKTITALYYDNNHVGEAEFNIGRAGKHEHVVIERVKLFNQHQVPTRNFEFGDSMTVELELSSKSAIESPYVWILIKSARGPLSAATGMIDGYRTSRLTPGKNIIRCTFFNLPLLNNTYYLHVGIRASNGLQLLTDSKDVASFNIVGSLAKKGLNGTMADSQAENLHSPLIPYEWEFNDGTKYKFDLHERFR